MTEVGIGIKLTENVGSTIPRVTEGLGRLERSFASVMDMTEKAGEAFEHYQEQLRAVHTAEAVSQATRPLQGTDQPGRTLTQQNNQQNPFMVNGQNVFAEMRKELKTMVSVMRDVLHEVSDTKKPGVPAESSGEPSVKKKSKFEKEYDEQQRQQARGVIKDTDRIRQVMTGFASGNPGAALQSIGSDIATNGIVEKWGALPGIVKGGIIGGLAAGATIMGLNAMTEQYQKVMRPSMDTAAMLGQLGQADKNGDVYWKNHDAILKTMSGASILAGKYGYDTEEGLAVQREYAKDSGKGYSEGQLGNVFAYSRGFGASTTDLGRFQGVADRFGQGSSALGYVAGGLGQSGMSAAQFQEYMHGTLSIFEEGLSKGIVRGFDDITQTQNMVARFGDTWKGEYGARKIQSMSDSIAQGANLQSEEDVIKYRAAMSISKTDDIVANQMLLEKGFTPQMFKAIGEQIKALTGDDKTAAIQLYQKVFGGSVTDAVTLQKNFEDKAYDKAVSSVKSAPSANSPELKLLESQERLLRSVREIASGLIPAKAEIVSVIASVPEKIAELFGVDLKSIKNKELHDPGKARSEYEDILQMNDSTSLPFKDALAAAYLDAESSQASKPGEYEAGKKLVAFIKSAGNDFVGNTALMESGILNSIGKEPLSVTAARISGIKESINSGRKTKIGNRNSRAYWYARADDSGMNSAYASDVIEGELGQPYAKPLADRISNLTPNTFNALIDSGAYTNMYRDITDRKKDGLTAQEIKEILTNLISKLEPAMQRQAALELNIQLAQSPAAGIPLPRGGR